MRYAEGNKLVLTAEVKGSMGQDADALKAYVEAQCGKAHVPGEIFCNGMSTLDL